MQADASGQSTHTLPLGFGPPLTGAPFSATRTLDYEPVAGSSDPVPVHAEEKISRDSAGRTRSEFKYVDRLPTVDILDVVAHVHYRWTVGDNVVTRYPMKETAALASQAIVEKLDETAPLVEGVSTRHFRSVGGKPGEIPEVTESWYSPELHLAMLTIVDKPAVGKTTYRFQHLSRAEPDATLFRVPPGYTMDDPAKPPPPANLVASETVSNRPAIQNNDASTHAAQPPYMDDPKFQKALAQAQERKQTQEERLDNWKHANKVAHEQCVACLREIVTLQAKTGAYKDAVKSAQQMEALATQSRDVLFAESMRGEAQMRFNYGQPKPEQLQQAEAAFQDVLAKSPQAREILFEDGRALAMLGRDAEARSAFAKYVEMSSASDKLRTRAERFSDDPHLATLPMAPPFRMVTSGGEELQLDNMNGKVVVLDFWATWCGPCKETLPEVARIAKDYANDPMLVLISVSTDSDAGAWQKFVEKNNMTWPQYRDANHALSTAYSVNAIPHFFTIDTNGALKTEQVGSNADVRRVVSDLVKKAHKAEAQKAKTTDHGSGQ
ncbi:MAG: redoxin family protein [Acidobacteriaceae bacterium]